MVQNIGAVGRRNNNDLVVCIEAIHLHEDCIERLLAFVVSAADEARAAFSPDGVNLIEKDNTGRILFGLFEQVAYPRRAHPDKHFYEIAA